MRNSLSVSTLVLALLLAAAGSVVAEPAKLDLRSLESRLSATAAIGPASKSVLRGQIDEIALHSRQAHAGGDGTLPAVRARYEKMLAGLHYRLARDPALARQVIDSRESIWKSMNSGL